MTPDPDHIDAVLFDLGGVLIELVGVEQMLAWSRNVATADELWRRWLHSEAVRRFETGRATRDEFAQAMVAEFGLPVPPAEFLAAFTWWPRSVMAGAHDLVAEVRAGRRVASVSNTNEIHWDRFSSAWRLHEAFDHNFPSHLVGKLKPDAEYFAHVVEDLGVRPERVLFVDDNAINVEGAARAGLHARRVAGVDGARAAFVELGLLPPG